MTLVLPQCVAAAGAGRAAGGDQFSFARRPHRQALHARAFAAADDLPAALAGARRRFAAAAPEPVGKACSGPARRNRRQSARAQRGDAGRRTNRRRHDGALNLSCSPIVVACALSVVTSQHKARKLYVELQNEQERCAKLDIEWGSCSSSRAPGRCMRGSRKSRAASCRCGAADTRASRSSQPEATHMSGA